tara:strand:+ start:767 stop:2140 length:1374 start_codon:yes stop_codon:yes gene_type:complete
MEVIYTTFSKRFEYIKYKGGEVVKSNKTGLSVKELDIKKSQPIYAIISKNQIQYIYFPNKNLEEKEELYLLNKLTFELNSNVKIVNQIKLHEINYFKDALHKLNDELSKTISEFKQNYKEIYLVIPKFGGVILYNLIKSVYNINYDKYVHLLNYSSGNKFENQDRDLDRKINIILKKVFDFEKSVGIIFFDEMVSGNSINQLWKRFNHLIDNKISLIEERYYHANHFLKKFPHIFKSSFFSKTFSLREDYTILLDEIINYYKSGKLFSLVEKTSTPNEDLMHYLQEIYFLEIQNLINYTKTYFYNYYSNNDKNLFKELERQFIEIKNNINFNDKKKIIAFLKLFKSIIQRLCNNEDGLIYKGILEKGLHEWMDCFNFKIKLIGLHDTRTSQREFSKSKQFSRLFVHDFCKLYKCKRNIIEDILTSSLKKEMISDPLEEILLKINDVERFKSVLCMFK